MAIRWNPPARIPVLLDGDPGHDDAMAWMLAKASPALDIRGVTSVCGNQTIEKTTYNALRVMTLLGIDAPMAKGRPAPLAAEPMAAPSVHGESGLDGPDLPEPDRAPLPCSAAAATTSGCEASEVTRRPSATIAQSARNRATMVTVTRTCTAITAASDDPMVI